MLNMTDASVFLDANHPFISLLLKCPEEVASGHFVFFYLLSSLRRALKYLYNKFVPNVFDVENI